MITTPNRLIEIRDQIERGEAVDWNKYQLLVATDLVIAGRQFVESAILDSEEWDERFAAAATAEQPR